MNDNDLNGKYEEKRFSVKKFCCRNSFNRFKTKSNKNTKLNS